MAFDSIENKRLIWDLLYKNGVFDNIPNSRIDNIKVLIDNSIKEIYINNRGHSILELNKILMTTINDQIKNYSVLNSNINSNTNSNINKSNTKVIRNWKSSKFNVSNLKNGWMPPHPTLFIRKNIICPNFMYNEKLKISSDYQMILKLFSQKNFNAIYIDKYLVRMRVGGTSNKSLGNIILKTYEDFISLKVLKLTINKKILCLIKKNLSKLNQFIFT